MSVLSTCQAGSCTATAARVQALTKTYGQGDAAVHALRGVSLGFAAGHFTAIMGPSGSGKSTLLQLSAGLDTPTSGHVWLGETDLTELSEHNLTLLRRNRLGFVFQSFNLLPTLTALENITLPSAIAGRRVDQQWLDTVIDTVGLRTRLSHRPSELSGGQQQRVAAARALAGRPAIVFADEPTGALDSRAATELLAFLQRAVHELGQTIVMVTHDPAAAAFSDRVVFLVDGAVVHEMADPTAAGVLDTMKTLGG